MNHRLQRRVLLGVFTFWITVVPAAASAPGDQIQGAITKVLEVLKDPSLKSEGKKKERLERLRTIIEPQFEFTEMAKRSLGAQWQRRTPAEQQEFITLFRELIESSYVDSIDSYDGEKVIVTSQKQDKDYAEVNTKIVTKKGEEFSVNYKLMSANDRWKVYDVVIENISLVNNYRSQFSRIISQSSYEDLTRKMKQKEMAAPAKKS
jgi:phospholipid transport system substrate-binding protein